MLRLPNHTQVPNAFMDDHLKDLNGASIKVFLVICRKTIGWHKATEAVSYTQLEQATGLVPNSVLRAISELEERGLLLSERRSGMTTRYTVNFATTIKSEVDHYKNDSGTPPKNDSDKRKERNSRKRFPPPPKEPKIDPTEHAQVAQGLSDLRKKLKRRSP